MSDPVTPQPTPPWVARAMLIVAMAGFGAALYLTLLHINVYTDPAYSPGCDVSAKLNCSAVAESRYSILAGVPIAVWGLLFYLGMIGMLVWRIAKPGCERWPQGLVLLAGVGAALYAAWLAWISHVLIEALCIGCMVLYAVNGLLLVLVLVQQRYSPLSAREAIRKDLSGLLGNRPLQGLLLAVAVPAAGLLAFYPDYWTLTPLKELHVPSGGLDESGAPWMGASPQEARMTIVEFADYQCPHCRREHVRIREYMSQNPDTIRLLHRNLPLDDACNPQLSEAFHPASCMMARFAQCAAEQGRFRMANDELYRYQDRPAFDPEEMIDYLNLDREAFRDCVRSPETADHVARDIALAHRYTIRTTPAYVIHGRVYKGRIPDALFPREVSE